MVWDALYGPRRLLKLSLNLSVSTNICETICRSQKLREIKRETVIRCNGLVQSHKWYKFLKKQKASEYIYIAHDDI